MPQIEASHTASDGTIRAPRIHEDLHEHGERVGRRRIARLMRREGIQGVHRRRGATTRQGATEQEAADLLRRDFNATGPDELCMADITYVPTWASLLYLG